MRNDLIKQAAIKQAAFNFSGLGSKMLELGGLAVAMTVVPLIIDRIIGAVDKLGVKAKSKKYYLKMLEAHPELKEKDPELVAKYWASLFHFSPFMAEDPLASGAFILQSINRVLPEQGGPPPDTFATLAGINSDMADSRSGGIKLLPMQVQETMKHVNKSLLGYDSGE